MSININDLRKLSNKIIIDDKEYCMSFIPYPVEKDIYSKFDYITGLFNNISNIKEDDIEILRVWINQILSHPKNKNDYKESDFFDSVGVTEIVIIMTSIIDYISKRIIEMNGIFGNNAEKKTMEKS